MPSRRTLLDAIRVQNALGVLSDTRAAWLNVHKDNELLFWCGVEQGFADACSIPKNSGVTKDVATTMMQAIDAKAITRNLLQWHDHPSDLVDTEALQQLHTLAHFDQGKPVTHAFDAEALEASLNATTDNICDLLNRELQTTGKTDDKLPLTPLGFASAHQCMSSVYQNAIFLGADHLEAADLWFTEAELDTDTLEILKGTLHHIDYHLHPLMTPHDILDSHLMDEEIEEELAAVETAAEERGEAVSEELIERLEGEMNLCIIVSLEDYECHSERLSERRAILADWEPGLTCQKTVKALHKTLRALPPISADTPRKVRQWADHALTRIEAVNQSLDQQGQLAEFSEIRRLDCFVPVFPADHEILMESVQDMHEWLMQGDAEENAALFDWNPTPAQMQAIATRLAEGSKLLQSLVLL